jgi:hypothetical protein
MIHSQRHNNGGELENISKTIKRSRVLPEPGHVTADYEFEPANFPTFESLQYCYMHPTQLWVHIEGW